jgi:SAM-dependent methyltransferase
MTSDLPPPLRAVRASYDAVAARYANEVADELAAKPLDRALLAAFAEQVRAAPPRERGAAVQPGGPGADAQPGEPPAGARPGGPGGKLPASAAPPARPVWDVGCGPGHVTAHLASLGLAAAGIDLSPAMIRQARARYPGQHFTVGSMTGLPSPDAAWHGIVAFYSLIHLTDDADLRLALREFRRVLTRGGLLLAAVHTRPPADVRTVPAPGGQVTHLDSWWDIPVDVSFRFFQADWLAAQIEAAGFTVQAVTWRVPYPGAETPTQRACLLARAG